MVYVKKDNRHKTRLQIFVTPDRWNRMRELQDQSGHQFQEFLHDLLQTGLQFHKEHPDFDIFLKKREVESVKKVTSQKTRIQIIVPPDRWNRIRELQDLSGDQFQGFLHDLLQTGLQFHKEHPDFDIFLKKREVESVKKVKHHKTRIQILVPPDRWNRIRELHELSGDSFQGFLNNVIETGLQFHKQHPDFDIFLKKREVESVKKVKHHKTSIQILVPSSRCDRIRELQHLSGHTFQVFLNDVIETGLQFRIDHPDYDIVLKKREVEDHE